MQTTKPPQSEQRTDKVARCLDPLLPALPVGNNAIAERLLNETSSGGFSVNETVMHCINLDLPHGESLAPSSAAFLSVGKVSFSNARNAPPFVARPAYANRFIYGWHCRRKLSTCGPIQDADLQGAKPWSMERRDAHPASLTTPHAKQPRQL